MVYKDGEEKKKRVRECTVLIEYLPLEESHDCQACCLRNRRETKVLSNDDGDRKANQLQYQSLNESLHQTTIFTTMSLERIGGIFH